MRRRAASCSARACRNLVCSLRPRRAGPADRALHDRRSRPRSLGRGRPPEPVRLPPALAASATARILEELGEPPQRVLELGFAGIQAVPLRLAGFDVTVVEPDPEHRARARERAGEALADVP